MVIKRNAAALTVLDRYKNVKTKVFFIAGTQHLVHQDYAEKREYHLTDASKVEFALRKAIAKLPYAMFFSKKEKVVDSSATKTTKPKI